MPQYHHVSDVTPTVLEAIGIEAPAVYNGVEQMPVEGTSFAYTFDATCGADAQGDAVLRDARPSRDLARRLEGRRLPPAGRNFDDDRWELYHLDNDFSESSDLADEHPERLRELVDLWWDEARKHNVLPISDIITTGFSRPGGGAAKRAFTFYAGATVPSMAAPNAANRSHRITAYVERTSTAGRRAYSSRRAGGTAATPST